MVKIENFLKKVKGCNSWGFERLKNKGKCSVCGAPARFRHYGLAGSVCDFHYQIVLEKKKEWESEMEAEEAKEDIERLKRELDGWDG